MKLKGKKVAILVENNYQEMEFYYPYYRLLEEGAEVIVVGSGRDVYTSKNGYPARQTVTAGEVAASDVDGVIVPGGYAPDIMRTNDEMVKLVREAFDGGKVVAAICHAGWMLASAGVLAGKKATAVRAIRDDMVNAGCEFLDQEVMRDGNLITSRTPPDLPAFMRETIAALDA